MDPFQILLLFLSVLVYLLLLEGQFSGCFLELHLLLLDQVLQPLDLLIVLVHGVFKLQLTSFIL